MPLPNQSSPRLSAPLFRLEADAQARTRGLGEALQLARRRHGLAAFQAGDKARVVPIAFATRSFRHSGLAVRLDARRRDGEFVFERIISFNELRVLAPLWDGFLRGHLTSFALLGAVSISQGGGLRHLDRRNSDRPPNIDF